MPISFDQIDDECVLVVARFLSDDEFIKTLEFIGLWLKMKGQCEGNVFGNVNTLGEIELSHIIANEAKKMAKTNVILLIPS